MSSKTSNSDNSNSPMLTEGDVRKLLSEPVAETRVALARKIGRGYGSGELSKKELEVAEQIFRLLLKDTTVQVRSALAESLKDDPSVPKDIIKTLAKDVDEVSTPVIESSTVLEDDDLIELIKNNTEITKHIAIANRKHVSYSVADALVETENEQVVGSLVLNEGAEISEKGFKKALMDFPQSSLIPGNMSKRSNLPVSVVENLLNIVSDAVAQELKGKYKGVARRLDEEAQKTREKMTLTLLETTVEPKEVQAMVNQLHQNGRLTPSIILTALCRGNFNFFEISLAKMADIPTTNARKLINDKGALGFRSLYKKAGLPESMFDACRLLLEVLRDLAKREEFKPGSIHFANRIIEQILVRSDGQEIDNLSYIIALIRQNAR